jgi:anti-sigma factor RsiW
MRSERHLSEQALNMYLDGESNADERDRAKAHLDACETCRAELHMLRELFVALEELKANPAPAPDLAPSVLARVHPHRRNLGLRWLVPTLQGVATLALLAWGWTRLTGYWTAAVIDALPTKALAGTWSQAAEWVSAQWARLHTLPTALWSSTQNWLTHPSLFGSFGFSVPQVVMAGAVLGTLWLACNVMLLRRSQLNGHKTQG